MSKPVIEKIVMRLGSQEVILTPQEAREVQKALNDLFGGPTVVKEYVWNPPNWTWQQPYITWSSTGTTTEANG